MSGLCVQVHKMEENVFVVVVYDRSHCSVFVILHNRANIIFIKSN